MVQFAHGMSDYGGRYQHVFNYLAEHGYVAAYNDHLGHGKSAAAESDLGFFAPQDGYQKVIGDFNKFYDILGAKYPTAPHFVMGHSMGSFIEMCIRDSCITCRVCEKQCSNGVHHYNSEENLMLADESACVDCQRCVSLCPTRALKIEKSSNTYKVSHSWKANDIEDIYLQAGSGGVLLSSMGNPAKYPIYWDKILLNASQVTNPSIDPLREPMETRTYLGKKNVTLERDAHGRLKNTLPVNLKLNVPIMFGAMSYGAISRCV